MLLYVADDNAEFAEYCAQVARREGWTVEVFHNGSTLLDKLRGGTEPVLVLCDVQMPEMDGIGVVHELPKIDRRLRVRFITGGPHSSALAARMIGDARDVDVGRFLTKPIRLEDLQMILRQEGSAYPWNDADVRETPTDKGR